MVRAFAWANNRRKVVASWLQRPPTSMASTTSLQRRVWRSSGHVRSFARLASWTAAPAWRPALLRGSLARVKGDTKVVSMASWTPPHRGSPLAMTSILRSSCRWRLSTFKSMSRVLVVTRAPASRQTLAAAFSSGTPRDRSTPAWAQAERWSPKGSRMRRHRQRRADRGKARRRRLKSRIRKICGWYVVSGPKGIVVNARLACGPDWESNMAWLAGSRWLRSSWRKLSWDDWAACRCHP